MTLIQSTPTTIYELNLNDFRLTLKNLEDSDEGMPYLKTHTHNTTVDVGGVTLARVINILSPYTITFEDGQYAVNLVGANSNVGDRVNVNQVSVRSANSAGLVTSAGIEAMEYLGGVTIDVVNGLSGAVYPKGTPRQPVNNLTDANIIANARGFNRLYIVGDITFASGDDIDDKIIMGENTDQTTITLNSGCSTDGAQIRDAVVEGTLDGATTIRNCNINDLEYVQGSIQNCMLFGIITLAGSGTVQLIDCTDGDADGFIPTVDMGSSGRNLVIARYSGDIRIKNLTGNQYVSLDMVSGKVWLDSTITAGYLFVRGTADFEDDSTGATIDTDGLVNQSLKELLGLSRKNAVYTALTWDANGQVLTAKVDVYSDNSKTTLERTYNLSMAYSGTKLLTHEMIDA